MGRSIRFPTAESWPAWPVLKRLQGWMGLEPPTAPSWEMATQAAAADTGEPCVLVADDSAFNRRLAAEMLLGCGVQPVLAADGEEAVRLAREVRLDLILMDLQMPVLDGRSATHRIRRDEHLLVRARVPVLAYSASPMPARVLSADGFDGALDKPCQLQALNECLMRWCVCPPGPARATASAMPPGR